MTIELPDHPVLAKVAQALDEAGLAAMVMDAGYNVIWLSREWEALFVGAHEDEFRLLLGTNVVHFLLSGFLRRHVSLRAGLRAGVPMTAAMLADVPGGKATLNAWLEAELGEGAGAFVDTLEPNPSPIWWSTVMVSPAPGMARVKTSWIGVRLYDPAGSLAGHVFNYGFSVPFRYVPMLAMGDPDSLERLATLTQPARHDVVVLSADLQDSAVLARRLSTAAFFDLVTQTTSLTDREIVKRGGIVGRHAGDGVIAFFLAEHHGGASAAVRAAIEVATSLAATIDQAAAYSVGAHVPVNVALHWGNVFMGQLSSEGRLEVTALGDAVNECARIGECARDGAVLASKGVIEQLGTDDAKALGLDPARVGYERLEDLPTVSAKAKRDAGGIAVTQLPARTPREPQVDDAVKRVMGLPEPG